jgi:peptide/nickel transport system substrate-binding protein
MVQSSRAPRTGIAPLLVCLVLTLGCTRQPARDGDRPFEILVAADAETLDPRYVSDSVGMRVTRLIHAGLVRLDPDTLSPVPYVARRWEWMDALTLRVELRGDVRFHSGAPLRSRDVVATLQAFASPQIASRHARVVEAIADAREDGDGAVVIRLARPHATLLTDLELPILRADEAIARATPDSSLDGLGPYRIARVSRGDILLSPADGAALPRPAHAVAVRTVHDENARALRLEAGRADVAMNVISPTLLPALAGEPGIFIRARPGANLTYLVVNEVRAQRARLPDGPSESGSALGDATVRRAISMAIDRALLCSTLFDGRAHPASGLIAPANWAHADTPPLPFDPAQARTLLERPGGGRLHWTLLTSTERLRGDVARVIAQELGDVGVAIDVIPLEIATMIARLNAGDFDLATLQLPEMTEPNVLRNFLHGSFVPPSGANRGRVHDDELDSLLDEGDRTAGAEERRRVYARVEARERDQMHLLPLWYEDQVVVTSLRARAFVPSAEGRWLAIAAIP